MKIFLQKANENWICDRFVEEWEQNNPQYCVENVHSADIIWLLAGWAWAQIPPQYLQAKKVVTTIHHIDPTKFDEPAYANFMMRDSITDFYHVPCEKTKQQIQPLTRKKILVQPFWVNQDIWNEIPDKLNLRSELGLPTNKFFVGSFQRDTEGHDLKSPKLSKGPDIFCDIIEKMHEDNENTEVILAGWRRQYVINRLKEKNINFHYFEWADFELLNKLYNCLDLYLVSSRCEGGPQSVVECAISKTPIVSTDVGLASDILAKESLYKIGDNIGTPNVEIAHRNIQKYLIPNGFNNFIKFFETIYEG